MADKMNQLTKYFLGSWLFLILLGLETTSAQELKKTRSDYHSGGVQYSPDDPWTRSKVFQAHTGHAGFFYNCDQEECKRYSPYIYWKSNCQPLWPARIRLIDGIQADLAKVRWRIDAGCCGCQYCLSSRDCSAGQNCQSPSVDRTCSKESTPPQVSPPAISKLR